MSTIDDLHTGFATLLAAAGVGQYQTDPTVPYGDGAAVIVSEAMPASPDRAIALTLFPLTVNTTLASNRYLLQVRARGLQNNATDSRDLDEAVMNALVGLTNRVFGSALVVQVLFYSSVPLGQDDSVRFERSTKYFVDVDVPPTSLRPEGGA
jgi:hypothetical protein